jgi:hypothetical protein
MREGRGRKTDWRLIQFKAHHDDFVKILRRRQWFLSGRTSRAGWAGEVKLPHKI